MALYFYGVHLHIKKISATTFYFTFTVTIAFFFPAFTVIFAVPVFRVMLVTFRRIVAGSFGIALLSTRPHTEHILSSFPAAKIVAWRAILSSSLDIYLRE